MGVIKDVLYLVSICAYMCMCLYKHICTYVCIYIHCVCSIFLLYIFTFIYIYSLLYVNSYIEVLRYIYVCICVCVIKILRKNMESNRSINVTSTNYFWSIVGALSQLTCSSIPFALWISFYHKHIFIFIIKNLVKHWFFSFSLRIYWSYSSILIKLLICIHNGK